MTSDQAKQVLLRYCPGTPDALDSQVVEALEFAKSEPAMQMWLAAHEHFQNSFRAEWQRIPVPPDLKSRILRQRPLVISFWRSREFLAIAASLAILLAGGAYWLAKPSENETFVNFQSRMVGFALRTYAMDILTTDGFKVREYLKSQGAPADFSFTPALSRLPVKGGARLSWHNHPVGMICFAMPQNETLYLFVIDRDVVQNGVLPSNKSLINPGNHLSTATWSDGRRIYLLAAHADSETLAKFLGG